MSAVDILMVEDNPAEVRLIREAFKDGQLSNRLHLARDGVEAMQFLRRQAPFDDARRPDVVLLDLNLPRKDGREVLAEIKADPELKKIPVVVLSTSDAGHDIAESYALQANCYITKPFDLGRYMEIVRPIESFWLGTAKLPRAEQAA